MEKLAAKCIANPTAAARAAVERHALKAPMSVCFLTAAELTALRKVGVKI